MLPRNAVSFAFLLPALAAPLLAAVVVDPVLTTGPSAIAPVTTPASRSVDILANNSTSISTLINQPDFRGTIQDGWAGFARADVSTTNIFSFTDSSLPAVSFTLSGSYGAAAGSNILNRGRTTSGLNGYNIVGNAGGSSANPITVTLTINLGSYNSATEVFTNGATVNAVGFTVAALLSTATASQTATAYFYNASNTLLSTQSIVTTGAGGDQSGFFGYAGDGSLANGVSKIVLDILYQTGGTTGKGLDDFGFTSVMPIPESSTYALIAGFAGLCLAASRRRR